MPQSHGRPPLFGCKDEERITPRYADILLGKEDDPALIWEVSRPEILRLMESVNGIAKLALLNRKTIRRKKWPPNSIFTLAAVRDHRSEIGRPLIRLSGSPEYYWPFRVKRALALCRQFHTARKKTVRSAPEIGTVNTKTPRRVLRNAHDVNNLELEPEEIRKLRLSGKFWKRTNPSRVTIRQLGLGLGITAPSVRKWLLKIPLDQKTAIDSAMRLPRAAIVPAVSSEDQRDPRSLLEAAECDE